jgi:hypothetical protein
VKARGHLEMINSFDEERPSQISKELFGSNNTNKAVETCVQVLQLPQYLNFKVFTALKRQLSMQIL